MLATDSTPTAATIVAVVTATLNAGAVPAMPMTADSKAPSEFPAKPRFSGVFALVFRPAIEI